MASPVRTRRGQLARAVVASALIHAVPFVAITRLRPPPGLPLGPQTPGDVTTIELVETPALPAPDLDPSASFPSALPAPAAVVRPTPSRAKPRPAPVAPAAAEEEARAQGAAGGPVSAARAPAGDGATARWLEMRPRAPAAPLQLGAAQLQALVAPTLPPPSAAPVDGRDAPRTSVADRLEEWRREEAARDVVARGKADPFLFEVERTAAAVFRPGGGFAAGDPRALGAAESVRAWARGLVEGFRQHLATLDDPAAPELPTLAPKVAPLVSPSPRDRLVDVLKSYNQLLSIAAAGAARFECEVCAVFAPDAAPTWRLRRSSDNAAVDALALDALARAAGRRPVPARLAPTEACYAFEVTLARVPPVPLAGCALDDGRTTSGLSCYRAFSEVVTPKVRLLSVRPLPG